jgi:hypothetical protein
MNCRRHHVVVREWMLRNLRRAIADVRAEQKAEREAFDPRTPCWLRVQAK